MERRSLNDIVHALEEAETRFVITGGLAVVAHGYLRFTANVDLLLDPAPDAWQRALRALGGLGYAPNHQFRYGMPAIELGSTQHVRTPVLLVLAPEVDFENVYLTSLILEAAPELWLRFVSKQHLLASKRSLPRSLDSLDVEKLESLPELGAGESPVTEVEWPVGWEEHERAQLARTAILPLSTKLEWLEEAQALAEHLQRKSVRPSPEK